MKKLLNMKKLNNQAGFALQDVMMGLVIFLGVSALAYALYATGSQNSKLAEERSNITHIVTQIEDCYRPFGGDYTNLNNARAIGCGAFTQTMLRGSTNPTNAFQGTVTVAVDTNVRRYTITEGSIPGPDACIKLAGFQNGEWFRVTVNGTNIPQDNAVGAKAAAEGACRNNNTNTLVYTRG